MGGCRWWDCGCWSKERTQIRGMGGSFTETCNICICEDSPSPKPGSGFRSFDSPVLLVVWGLFALPLVCHWAKTLRVFVVVIVVLVHI